MYEDLRNDPRFKVRLINTSRQQDSSNPLRNLTVALKTLFAVLFQLGRTDIVSFHASDRGMFLFGPLIVTLCKLTGKPTVLRVFGGSFGDFYFDQSTPKKWIIRKLLLSSDVMLLQTRRSIHQLKDHATGHLEWFSTYVRAVSVPNERPGISEDDGIKTCRKFIYLGHLWRTKGIEIMLEAAADLPPDTSIDLYGPLDEYTEDDIRNRGKGRVRYRGFLAHEHVDATLRTYDCLVLPTFHPGEGYPGVIAEAFSQGLPVITTQWLAIPEIVDEECGILIPPNDSAALIAAIATLRNDRDRWRKLCRGAQRKAAQFDHDVWSSKFESICEELVA